MPNILISDYRKFIVLIGEGALAVVEIPKMPYCNNAPTNLDELDLAPYVLTRVGKTDLLQFSVRTRQLQKAESTISCYNGKVLGVLTIRSRDRPTIYITGIRDYPNLEQQLNIELEVLNLLLLANIDYTILLIIILKAP